jgi:hypothetical protein
MRQVWIEETNASEPLMTDRNDWLSTSKAGWLLLRDQSRGCLLTAWTVSGLKTA